MRWIEQLVGQVKIKLCRNNKTSEKYTYDLSTVHLSYFGKTEVTWLKKRIQIKEKE